MKFKAQAAVLLLLAAAARAEPPMISDTLHIAGSSVRIVIPPAEGDAGARKIVEWVRRNAVAVAAYYRGFPVHDAEVRVFLEEGSDQIHAKTFGGRLIRVQLGDRFNPENFKDDWVMAHEMSHLAFPDLDARLLWMQEGLATYLEPLMRARAGQLSEEKLWGDLLAGLPKGLPAEGDQGMDRTHTWGRTYWGGARFWLLADMRIREQTQNKKSLDDVLRAILEQGGDGSRHWTLEQVLAAAQKATGLDVLEKLHAEMGLKAEAEDLPALWKKLGVKEKGGKIIFDDAAPAAELRRGITRRS